MHTNQIYPKTLRETVNGHDSKVNLFYLYMHSGIIYYVVKQDYFIEHFQFL